MTHRLVIVGAGGFGRGVYSWVTTSPRYMSDAAISEVVFVDDHPKRGTLGAPCVSTLSTYSPSSNDRLIVAIGSPEARRTITELLATRGARFATFVDDRAVLGLGVRVGTGSVICPGVVISAQASLGKHTHVNFNCSVGHDTRLGEYTTLSPSVNIMGEVLSGDSVFYGGSSAVLPRLRVGNDATVAAGAVVTLSVESGWTVAGIPAKPLKKTVSS